MLMVYQLKQIPTVPGINSEVQTITSEATWKNRQINFVETDKQKYPFYHRRRPQKETEVQNCFIKLTTNYAVNILIFNIYFR